MERAVRILAVVLGVVVSAGVIGAAVSGAVAARAVEPVKLDVRELQAQRADNDRRLGRIEEKVDRILERVR